MNKSTIEKRNNLTTELKEQIRVLHELNNDASTPPAVLAEKRTDAREILSIISDRLGNAETACRQEQSAELREKANALNQQAQVAAAGIETARDKAHRIVAELYGMNAIGQFGLLSNLSLEEIRLTAEYQRLKSEADELNKEAMSVLQLQPAGVPERISLSKIEALQPEGIGIIRAALVKTALAGKIER